MTVCIKYEPLQTDMDLMTQVPSSADYSLRKHAYSNILKISPPKAERFQIKILIFFIFLLKT